LFVVIVEIIVRFDVMSYGGTALLIASYVTINLECCTPILHSAGRDNSKV
jgi:hypothetical protein